MFLRQPLLPIDAALASVQDQPVEAVEKLIRARAATDAAVREHLAAANRYATTYANKHRRRVEFAVDDLVLLSTTNLPLPTTLTRKLAPKWIGPLRVLARVGAVAYRVQLPDNLSRLHPVFHVGLLKPFTGTPPPVRAPVFTTAGGADDYEVERIEAHKLVRGQDRYLVVWKGYPIWEATWEPASNLDGCPELLEEFRRARGLED